MEAIKTENLTKYYGKSRGVLELNLSVEQGEVFGFIGPIYHHSYPAGTGIPHKRQCSDFRYGHGKE